MKKFLTNIFLYIGSILFVLFLFECSLYTQENEFSYKKHYIETHLNDIKILTLGSSLFEISIDPSLIGESIFNGNLSGIGNIYKNSATYQMAVNYVPQMKNLEVLIVPFPLNDVYAGSDDWKYEDSPTSKTFKCLMVKYLHILTDPRDIVYWSEILNSSMDYIGRFQHSNKENRMCDSLGFVSLNRELVNRNKDWDKPIETTIRLKPREETSHIITAYCDIAEICKANNVKFICIATPYHQNRINQIPQQMINDYLYVISTIKKKHPEVAFYNFTDDKRFTSNDFQDLVHLNNNGAKKFSKILKKEILSW